MSELRLNEVQEKVLIQVLEDMTPNLLTLEDEEEHIYASEIFCDYDAGLSDKQIYAISNEENPGAEAVEIFSEWEVAHTKILPLTVSVWTAKQNRFLSL